MNKDEKKALINFLAIYIVSTILLLGVILYIYYKNETKMLEESCSMQLHSTSMQIKNDIINKYMKNQKFNPAKLEDINMKYALFDKNKK